MTPEDLPDLLLAAVVLIVVAFAVTSTVADPDLWGHVRFGQDILHARSIPGQDSYSFTSDRRWINHEWLAEVLMASAYNMAGSTGLIGLKLLLAIGTFVVVWLALRDAGVYRPVAAGLLLAAIIGTFGSLITVRPQLFSMLLYTILLALLNEVGRGRWLVMMWMPVLFAFWANLHGGWIVGLGVLGLWSTCAILARTISWPWAAGGVLLGIFGTMMTPYGVELWRFLWETVEVGRADVMDWQPLTRWPILLIQWTVAAALVLAAWRRRGWVASPLLLPAAALGVLALRVVRLEPFFAVTAVILIAPCVATLGPERLPLSQRPARADFVLVGAMFLVGLLATGGMVRSRVECVTIMGSDLKESWAPEAEAVAFLRDNSLEGRLLSYFDYGEMAIWHLAPKLRVSFDGRRETVYSEAVRKAQLRLYSDAPDANYVRLLKADYIWLPHRLPIVDLLKREGWVVIFQGSRSVVLAPKPGPYAQPATWTGPRCFPGP